jgi:UDP-N-acetylglucosamine acyltransferase
VSGEKSRPRGVNSEGLKRRGFTPEQVQNVRRAYRTLYRSGLTLEEARVQLVEMAESAGELRTLVDFIGQSERAIIR